MNHDDESIEGSDGQRREPPPFKLLALLIVVAALAIFFFQNDDDVSVTFLSFDAEWPVWMVIALSAAAGIAVDRLGSWQWRRARRRKDLGER